MSDELSEAECEAMERERAVAVRSGRGSRFQDGWFAARGYYESELVRHIGAAAQAREQAYGVGPEQSS
jgi:hypothetical protein